MERKVLYSAVVLDERSRRALIDGFQQYIPEGWEVIAHHMTMTMGELPEEWKGYLGREVTLIVKSIGVDEKVVAVGVSGFVTKNEKPHITLAVNRAGGGKPFMSNNIQQWEEIGNIDRMLVTGTVEEIERK